MPTVERAGGLMLQVSLAALILVPSAARAQEPVGAKFKVNSYTTGLQDEQAIAAAANGDFVVVWSSKLAGQQSWDIFGQRYDARGRTQGAEFRVSEMVSYDPLFVDVATNAAGDFVVVWSDYWLDYTSTAITARRYAADGTPQSAASTIGSGSYPAVARTPDGAFVVVWNGVGGVVGRRFDTAGNPLGAEFTTGILPIADVFPPDVGVAANGDFVVVTSAGLVGAIDVVGRCFDALGMPRGPVFLVNSYTTGSQTRPRVALDSQGRFSAVWTSPEQDGNLTGVAARMFDSSCTPSGPDQIVNNRTTYHQLSADVASDASDAFLITWEDFQTPQRVDVMGRRISSTGAFRGAEFLVQKADIGVENSGGFRPKVAGGLEGVFNVVWYERPTGPNADVYGRRLRPLGARPMDVDGVDGPASDGNGVFEPGETVRVAPAWFNSMEQPLSAAGLVESFTGPAGNGVSYALTDPVANYGTIAAGSTANCVTTGDCHALGITQGAARPVPHWDALFVETLEPATLHEALEWTLHVGDSFQDVPRSSLYYRFIETLLHSGVTGGCAAGQFCPSNPTSREQMAVLVLKSKEGARYVPPACTFSSFSDVPVSSPYCPYIRELVLRGIVTGCDPTHYCPSDPVSREQVAVFVLRTLDPSLDPPKCTVPLFADVPASSPFCRWIEELARRGVVTGCGGGNYCPTQPVSREQMAVFLTAAFGLQLYGP